MYHRGLGAYGLSWVVTIQGRDHSTEQTNQQNRKRKKGKVCRLICFYNYSGYVNRQGLWSVKCFSPVLDAPAASHATGGLQAAGGSMVRKVDGKRKSNFFFFLLRVPMLGAILAQQWRLITARTEGGSY